MSAIQVGNTQLTQSGLSSTDSTQNIVIGIAGDTGNTLIQNAGLKFPSGNVQTDAGIPTSQKGAANGVVPLNGATKIDSIYLPAGGLSYQGIWNASTNTPTLADGVGNVGDQWIVGTAGTANLGSGPIAFALGDFAIYNSSNVWQDVPVGGTGVTSFNTRTGAVTLSSGDVTNALSAGVIVNSKLQNSNVTVNTGAGLSGGGTINLGGNVTLTANVNNITAGTGVTVTPSSGNFTIAIGQPVATTSSVQFGNVTVGNTIQATGNITGGNLSTANTVSVGGNVIANNVTSNTLVTANNISANGNINFTTSGNVALGSNANVKITGGSTGQLLSTNGTGNLVWISSGNIAPTSGTWTPTLVPETGSYTLTINNTYFQKIGGVAFCTFDITIASQSTPNGNVLMGNLPFTSAATAATTGSLAVAFYTGMNSPTNVVSGTVPGSATTVTMFWQGSSDTKMDPLTHNRLKATTRFVGSVYYATE